MPSNTAIAPISLPAPAAAEYLGVSAKTLSNWRSLGEGPRFARLGSKRGGRIVYPVAELERFLAEHLVDARSRAAS